MAKSDGPNSTLDARNDDAVADTGLFVKWRVTSPLPGAPSRVQREDWIETPDIGF